MAEPGLILVTGAGGGIGGVGGKVVALLRQRGLSVRAMVHHDDDPADALRALGADVVVGDLTRPADVAAALDSARRMFFSMSLAPSYLEAAATVATVARAVGDLQALVATSQMTVSQMDALSMGESHHQRLHFLSEQVLNWSGLPVVHARPTSSWIIRCSRPWPRVLLPTAARSGFRSGPVAPRQSRPATSRGSSLLSWPTRIRTSAASSS
jgi:uncharacterized protein YbjT (DUF2867 family)